MARPAKREIRPLQPGERDRFFRAVEAGGSLRDLLLFKLIYWYAMRASEAVELPADAVDRADWNIRIKGKKNGREGVYAVPVELRKLLRRWKPEHGTLLHGRKGPLSRETVWQLFRRYAHLAGIPEGIGPHSLRHTACTEALDAGANVAQVQYLARHRDIGSTMVYTQVTPKVAADLMQKLEIARRGR